MLYPKGRWEGEVGSLLGLLFNTDTCPRCLFTPYSSWVLLPLVHAEAILCSTLLFYPSETISLCPCFTARTPQDPIKHFWFCFSLLPSVSPDCELLTRKASSSMWPEKVETLYDARKAKQLFFCVWFPQQPSPHTHHFLDTNLRASSKRHRRWHGVFYVIAYSLDAANIISSCGVCHKQLDLGGWWRKGFRNGMMPTYRSQQWVDGQGLATSFQTDLPWFGKLVLF